MRGGTTKTAGGEEEERDRGKRKKSKADTGRSERTGSREVYRTRPE